MQETGVIRIIGEGINRKRGIYTEIKEIGQNRPGQVLPETESTELGVSVGKTRGVTEFGQGKLSGLPLGYEPSVIEGKEVIRAGRLFINYDAVNSWDADVIRKMKYYIAVIEGVMKSVKSIDSQGFINKTDLTKYPIIGEVASTLRLGGTEAESVIDVVSRCR